jgi:hypothetical protein
MTDLGLFLSGSKGEVEMQLRVLSEGTNANSTLCMSV